MTNKTYDNLTENVKVQGDRLEVKVSGKLKPDYVVEDFWMTVMDQDLEKVPMDIVLIPFIMNIAPVVWISNLNFSLETMDRNLANSLEILKGALEEMYPEYQWNGNLHGRKLTDNSYAVEENTKTFLFSGGLDAVSTSYKYLSCKQQLVTIHGADMDVDDSEGLKNIKAAASEYAEEIGAGCFFIQSNLREFLYGRSLTRKIGNRDWYGFVQHGMGLTSCMAIPAWISGSAEGYIASSHSTDFYDEPWGSHPEIDNKIQWANFQVSHDNYELSRQGKIQLIVDAVHKGEPAPYLRVCHESRGGKNCGRCEKCCRTMTGFMVAGEDFTKYGFDQSDTQLIQRTSEGFQNSEFKFSRSHCYFWKDIQTAVKSDEYYRKLKYSEEKINYLNWVKNFDFGNYLNVKEMQLKKYRERNDIKKRLSKIPGLLPFILNTHAFLRRLRGRA